jgi:hypothetical protein
VARLAKLGPLEKLAKLGRRVLPEIQGHKASVLHARQEHRVRLGRPEPKGQAECVLRVHLEHRVRPDLPEPKGLPAPKDLWVALAKMAKTEQQAPKDRLGLLEKLGPQAKLGPQEKPDPRAALVRLVPLAAPDCKARLGRVASPQGRRDLPDLHRK